MIFQTKNVVSWGCLISSSHSFPAHQKKHQFRLTGEKPHEIPINSRWNKVTYPIQTTTKNPLKHHQNHLQPLNIPLNAHSNTISKLRNPHKPTIQNPLNPPLFWSVAACFVRHVNAVRLGPLDHAHRVDVARFGGQVNVTTWATRRSQVNSVVYGGYNMIISNKLPTWEYNMAK